MKLLISSIVALSLISSPASARERHHRDRDRSGAIAGAIVGLVVGGLVASSIQEDRRYERRYERRRRDRSDYYDDYKFRDYYPNDRYEDREDCIIRRWYDEFGYLHWDERCR